MNRYNCSLRVDLSRLNGKTFKVVSDLTRSIVKQEHGYNGTKGLTDNRLSKWPIAIRFTTKNNRKIAHSNFLTILSPTVIDTMSIEKLKPKSRASKPVRIFK